MIRFVRRYKWTISTALVFAALITWAVWRADWDRLLWGAVYGTIVAGQVLARDLVKRWEVRHGW